MVIDEKTKKIRKDLANDLTKFYRFIQPFLGSKIEHFNYQKALTTLLNDKVGCINKEHQPTFWNYKIDKIVFKLNSDIPKNKLPTSVSDLKLTVNIDVSGDTNKEVEKDPFQTLALNFTIEGDFICDKTDTVKKALTTFHLDRHICNNDDNEPVEPHPFYHLQFGGKNLIDEYGDKIDTGGLLVLETPRIAHHPMEIILGLDYLIFNFYPNIRKRLMNGNQEYRRLVEKYQDKIIKPYFFSIASNWEKSLNNFCVAPNWTPTSLNPQIC